MATMDFNILSFNARGLNGFHRRRQTFMFIKKNNPDIICIQETRLSNSIPAAMIESSFPGYRMYINSSASSSGGVITLVSNNLSISSIVVTHLHSSCLNIKFNTNNNGTISLYNIYGPTNTAHKNRFFDDLITLMGTDPLQKIVVGDFNVSPSRNRSLWSKLNNVVDLELLSPTLASGKPQRSHTYFRRRISSSIDHCFVPFPHNFFAHLLLIPYAFSDHLALNIKISSSPILPSHRMSGCRDFRRWQPPTRLLTSPEFTTVVSSTIDMVSSEFQDFSPLLRWSIIKTRLKDYLFQIFEEDRVSTYTESKQLSALLIVELNKDKPDLEIIHDLKNEIQKLLTRRLMDIIHTTRTRTILNQERPTKYFFRYFHKYKLRNNIGSIVHPHIPSKVISSAPEIITALHSHYSHRFSSRQTSTIKDIQGIFARKHSTFIPKLQSIDHSLFETLDTPLPLAEIDEALTGLSCSDSAGPDGLGSRFYTTHKEYLLPTLKELFNFLATTDEFFHHSFQVPTAFSVPIPKQSLRDSKDPLFTPTINHFRIISTINFDLRLLAKIVNSRLGSVMKVVLHPGVFSVKGRNIQHSALLQFAATNNFSYLPTSCPQLLKIDLANAFDHTSIFHLSEHFVSLFGFTHTSRLLFHILSRRIIILKLFKTCSPVVTLVNGLLQGCPLSSSLFSIYIHPLVLTLHKRVQGLKLHNSGVSIRALSYVDDLSVGCSGHSDVITALRAVKDFQNVTGSLVNMEKTIALHLLPSSSKYDKSFSSRLSTRALSQKILGHYLLPLQKQQRDKQRQDFLVFAESFIDQHRHRKLSIGAKVRVINTMIISRLSFHILFLKLSVSWLNSFYKLVRKFLWNTIPYISTAKMFLPRRYGGLGLINLRLYIVLRRYSFMLSIKDAFEGKPAVIVALSQFYGSRYQLNDTMVNNLVALIGMDVEDRSILRYGTFIQTMCAHHHYERMPSKYITVIKTSFFSPGQFNFLFSLLHQALPLSTYLYTVKHLTHISTTCIMCQAHPETFEHLFFDCSSVLGEITPLFTMLSMPFSSYRSSITSMVWDNLPVKHIKSSVVLAHAIWRSRCERIFSTSSSNTHSIAYFYNISYLSDRLYLPREVFKCLW